MAPRPPLTLAGLRELAVEFAGQLSAEAIPELAGVTDGKRVGTYVEKRFRRAVEERYAQADGNSALGIDFPAVETDLKVTAVTQPQSSCPFRDATQKVYGLGYNLLVFVYHKEDRDGAARLDVRHVLLVPRERTADYQTSQGLLDILERDGNADDLDAFLEERRLPLDEIGRRELAERVLREPPSVGCLTISNALQWRLTYARAIEWSQDGRGDVERLA